MATKVLGTRLIPDDLQYLIGLAKTAAQRRQIRLLFNYQLKQIEQRGLLGIDNCKQLHNVWLHWLTCGCPQDQICSYRNRHGYKAKLQHAQRIYISLLEQGHDREALSWRDTVTTVLRSYQVCGPSKDDMKSSWNKEIRERITKPLDPNLKTCLKEGLLGVERHFNDSHGADSNIYTCGKMVKIYFDLLEKVPVEERKGFAKALSSLKIDISEGDYSLLLKRGPHKEIFYTDRIDADGIITTHVDKKSIISIFGESLDVHALSRLKIDLPNRKRLEDENPVKFMNLTGAPVAQSDESDFPEVLFSSKHDMDISMLDVINELNYAMVEAYKSQPGCNIKGSSLQYAPKEPVGQIPGWLEAYPGRMTLLQDKSGKVRAIAIATYTANNALAPLHEGLKGVLRGIPQDSTDQEKGISYLLSLTRDPKAFICSADLSAATDRLPAILQAYILYRVLKLSRLDKAEAIAEAWYLIMSQTAYLDATLPGLLIKYGAGDGMGIYTSWSVMALTNHVLVRVSYFFSDKRKFPKKYRICGDDTVIGDKSPTLIYVDCMNALGVTVNSAKSHITQESDTYKVAEFCKRLIVNGEIVSGVSPKLLIRAAREGGMAYGPAAIDCIQSIMRARMSKKKLASLLGTNRIDQRKLFLPFRYGGWGLVGTDPLHKELLKDNFIFLYIYKLMRSRVSAVEHVLQTDDPVQSQESIDSLSAYKYDNPYRTTDLPDWRLMSKKAYEPAYMMRSYLIPYERFLAGMPYQPDELVQMVEDTFNRLKDCPIPVRLYSNESIRTKSKEALLLQRAYTRAARNITAGKVGTFSLGVIPISIDIECYDRDDPSIEMKILTDDLDRVLFNKTEESFLPKF